MLEQVTQIHLFFPLLAIVLIVLIVTIGIVKIKSKDNGLFNNIFNRHSEEHEDTTTKMEKMHDNVVHLQFGIEHEQELDSLEKSLKKLDEDVQELRETVDLLFNKVIELEKQHKQ